MKPHHLLVAFTLVLPVSLSAQQAPPPPPLPSLAPFDWLDGTWRGEASIDTPGGTIKLTQTERSGQMLGGAVRLVEGRGYGAKGDLQFNALGAIYGKPDGKFEMHSWAQGRSGIFPVIPVDGGFDWEMPAGPMKIRYEARLVAGKWIETGYRVLADGTRIKFYRMELTRLGDSDWPTGGAVKP